MKNKVAAPFRQAEFDIDYGEGISRVGELLDLGVDHKIVNKSGAWYSYGDVRLGQGRENAKQFLRENPDLADEIEDQLRAEMGLKSARACRPARRKRKPKPSPSPSRAPPNPGPTGEPCGLSRAGSASRRALSLSKGGGPSRDRGSRRTRRGARGAPPPRRRRSAAADSDRAA